MAEAKTLTETPLMKQYNAIKARYPGALLLFRVGDFYETFGQDNAYRDLWCLFKLIHRDPAEFFKLEFFHIAKNVIFFLFADQKPASAIDQKPASAMLKLLVKAAVSGYNLHVNALFCIFRT